MLQLKIFYCTVRGGTTEKLQLLSINPNTDLIILNELRWNNNLQTPILPGYIGIFNYTRRKCGSGGTSVLIKKDLYSSVVSVKRYRLSFNTIIIYLRLWGRITKIITSYRPPVKEFLRYKSMMEKLFATNYSSRFPRPMFFIGNTNVNLLNQNERTLQLKNICSRRGVKICNHISTRKRDATWVSRTIFKTRNERGGIVLKKKISTAITDLIMTRDMNVIKMFWAANEFSDHKLLKLTIRPPTCTGRETLNFKRCICRRLKKRIKSPVWDFFGYAADKYNKIINEDKIVCQLCHHTLNNMNPSNMSKHLMNKHHNLPEYEQQEDIFCCFQNGETMDKFRTVTTTKIFSLSILRWENAYSKNVVLVSINSISSEDQPELNIHTINLRDDNIDLSWLELDNCVAVLVDNHNSEAAVKRAFDNEITISECLMNVILRAMVDCFALPEAKELVPKANSVIRNHGLPFYKVHPNFWIRQWHTLNFMCDLTNKTPEFLADETLNIILGPIKEIVEIMQPLNTAIETLSKGNPIAGLAKPYVSQLLKDLLNVRILNLLDNEMEDYVASIGETMHLIIKRHLNNYLMENHEFLTTAKFFHPRFHSTCDDAELIVINETIDTYFGEHNDRVLSGAIEEELMGYQAEIPLAFDKCPLEWWASHSQNYPKLKSMADSYLCVPAINIAAVYMNHKLNKK